MRSSDTEHQTRGGKDAVVRTQYRRAQPTDTLCAVALDVAGTHAEASFELRKARLWFESRFAEANNRSLLQASSGDIDIVPDGFTGYNEFNSPIFLASGGVIVRGNWQRIAEAVCGYGIGRHALQH